MIREVTEINGLKLFPGHKVILFCLESRGKKIFPSHDVLAGNCGLGETKLKQLLKELRDYSVINWIQVSGSSNRYRINRQAIADAYADYCYMQAQKANEELEVWDAFHPEWELAGVTN